MMPLDIQRYGKTTHDIVQMHISIMQYQIKDLWHGQFYQLEQM